MYCILVNVTNWNQSYLENLRKEFGDMDVSDLLHLLSKKLFARIVVDILLGVLIIIFSITGKRIYITPIIVSGIVWFGIAVTKTKMPKQVIGSRLGRTGP